MLACEARNPKLNSSSYLLASKQLRVRYRPVATAYLDDSREDSVVEGGNLIIHCGVKSFPTAYKVSWLHKGLGVKSGVAMGVSAMNQSLFLRGVRRSAAGEYACKVHNEVGESFSNVVKVNVKPYQTDGKQPDREKGNATVTGPHEVRVHESPRGRGIGFKRFFPFVENRKKGLASLALGCLRMQYGNVKFTCMKAFTEKKFLEKQKVHPIGVSIEPIVNETEVVI
ncbi:unnamed protein product [Darwinula stevensoni]|uniref:Ig-like domain-containing protein n=1 Tax=Darwinula stevensoni TaxID=69355 RepID=A0A7R9FQA6_9CRUS|nr:unnamed protein product [Darwinula stevensoni]CAG0899067.1 unnamed protein product [Darwinula stevensoni]